MSVLVKGMKMPNSCAVCRFAGRGGYFMERVVCMFTGKNDAKNVDRLPNCPLVALPDHHGRLGDLDALIIDLMNRGLEGIQTDDWAEIQQTVMEQPTIVGAEDENANHD